MSLKLEVMGHRGNKQFCGLDPSDPQFIRENSLESFEYSLVTKPSCAYIETDLRLTRDKRIVIIHDNVLKRCYNIDHEKTIDQIDFDELVGYGVPSFEAFLEWYLRSYKQEKKIILDIKSVVPLELLKYLQKELMEFAKNESELRTVENSFVLGLWTKEQVKYISEELFFLARLKKINITLSLTSFTNGVYKNNFNFIGCSIHYLALWSSSNLKLLFDFIGKNKDVFNEENPFVLTVWTVNEKNIVLKTLQFIRDYIEINQISDAFETLSVVLCTDNPMLMNRLFVQDNIFNTKQFSLKVSSLEIYKKRFIFNIIAYAVYSRWFTYEVAGVSFLSLFRKAVGI